MQKRDDLEGNDAAPVFHLDVLEVCCGGDFVRPAGPSEHLDFFGLLLQ